MYPKPAMDLNSSCAHILRMTILSITEFGSQGDNMATFSVVTPIFLSLFRYTKGVLFGYKYNLALVILLFKFNCLIYFH